MYGAVPYTRGSGQDPMQDGMEMMFDWVEWGHDFKQGQVDAAIAICSMW